jgi:hypothetical protein
MSDQKEAETFARAYAEWFAARARQEELNADHEDLDSAEKDREVSVTIDRVSKAELKLACTPAALPAQFVRKFEALETMISERERDGRPADNRHGLMLASVKADLYRFSLEPRSS